jgi:hypothetical protein
LFKYSVVQQARVTDANASACWYNLNKATTSTRINTIPVHSNDLHKTFAVTTYTLLCTLHTTINSDESNENKIKQKRKDRKLRAGNQYHG